MTIINMYIHNVQEKYGRSTVIVFDGYESGPSTKDSTHERRNKGHVDQMIHFTSDMVCKTQKDNFLSNKFNKQRLTSLE